jgi:hypothetical protein
MKERISVERGNVISQMGDEIDSPNSPTLGYESFKRKVPRETDNTGSSYRIRPQTPRINLLSKSKNNYSIKNNPSMKLEKLDNKHNMSI